VNEKQTAIIEASQLGGDGSVVRLVQVTDTHLNRNYGGELLGLDTDFSLQHVLNLVRSERENNDIVLVTGDISDHGAVDAYRRARDYFADIDGEKFWLPGNHDDRVNMASVTEGSRELSVDIRVANWQIVMLDTQIPGEVGGRLGDQQLQLLEECLGSAARANLFTLICLHHQPVAVGSGWLDQQMVEDADQFLALAERFSRVKGILWGHVHQPLERGHQGIKLMCTPSTCVQFAANSYDFKIEVIAPGYRWLELYADGRIETAISRVEGVEFKVDIDSTGYE